MAKSKAPKNDQPQTREERRARLSAREYEPLTRDEERAIVSAEQQLERLQDGLEYDD